MKIKNKAFKYGGLIILFLVFIAVIAFYVFALEAQEKQKTDERLFIVHLKGVYSADISLMPFKGMKALYGEPIGKREDVTEDGVARFAVPAEYLPGEFLLRIDYKKTKSDHPYPAEKNIFISKQDIELYADPLRINDSSYTYFSEGEKENTSYAEFIKQNYQKRQPLEVLKQFLISYDDKESGVYAQAIEEFNRRRQGYNAWLDSMKKKNKGLYISNLFQFQYIPKVDWQCPQEKLPESMLESFFEGIDFNNPLITNSREMSILLNSYVGLYGMQAKDEEHRKKLLTEAGRIACEKVSKGHPEVYGWIVDYFYNGYEAYSIEEGMAMLKTHAEDPNCRAKKKSKIIAHLKGSEELSSGKAAPNFVLPDNKNNDFNLHEYKATAPYKLIVFSLTGCSPCKKLKKELVKWYNEGDNRDKLDVIVVDLDGAESAKPAIDIPAEWEYLRTKGGIHNPIAKDYAVLSAPVMFLINSKDNTIVSSPDDIDELMKGMKGVRP